MKKDTLLLRIALILVALPVLALTIYVMVVITLHGDELNRDYVWMIYPLFMFYCMMTIPFIYAISQAFILLKAIDNHDTFSLTSVTALQQIVYAAYGVLALGLLAMPFVYGLAEIDDAPGMIILAMIIPFGATVIVLLATILLKVLKNAIEIKTENELTV